MKIWTNFQISILIGLAITLIIDMSHISKKIDQLDKRAHALELKIWSK